jgi:hypothetical protein
LKGNQEDMRINTKAFIPVAAFACGLIAFVASPVAAALAADVVTVGTVTAGGAVVDVPVYIRDTSGTPLGVDQPPGSKLQDYSIKVDYTPASAVTAVTFTRAGITTNLTPSFENSPSSTGSVSLIDTFQESTNPIPFTLNAAAPGNQVAHLKFTLASNVTPGAITLTLDPVLTQLGNDSGTTQESVGNATLLLVNGSITIPAGFVWNIPTMSQWALVLLAIALSTIAIRVRT